MKSVFLLLIIIIIRCKNDFASDKLKIGFSQGLGNHPWRDAMNHSMKIQASLYSDIDLRILKAEGSIKKQTEDIQKMIDDKNDVIIISPIDSKSLIPIIEKLMLKIFL
jgi:ABC-type sugar transport system substrate-binding protein